MVLKGANDDCSSLAPKQHSANFIHAVCLKNELKLSWWLLFIRGNKKKKGEIMSFSFWIPWSIMIWSLSPIGEPLLWQPDDALRQDGRETMALGRCREMRKKVAAPKIESVWVDVCLCHKKKSSLTRVTKIQLSVFCKWRETSCVCECVCWICFSFYLQHKESGRGCLTNALTEN